MNSMNPDPLDFFTEPTPAPMGKRVAAFLIDQILIFSVLLGVTFALGLDFGSGNDESANVLLAVNLFGVILGVGYHTVAVAQYRRTVGKRLMGLEVLTFPAGLAVTWSYSALRALVPAAAMLIPVVGSAAGLAVYLWAFLDRPVRRGLHDKLAGTLVTVRPVISEP